MNPQDLRYTTEHEWVRRTGEKSARFGITAYAAQEINEVVLVSPPELGAEVRAGQPCGEIESYKAFVDIYAPVSGTVVGVNDRLADAPELVNSAPYEDGWMVDLACPSAEALSAELAALMDVDEYEASLPQ